MREFGYGWEKLHIAVHILTGIESQRNRLIDAVSSSLAHIMPDKDLPEELRDPFEQFMNEMTSIESASEGSIRATINTLEEAEIRHAFERIISFYDTVCRYQKPLK